jgi:hypothetical protein
VKRVLERDGYQCQLRYADICVGRASQVDHIVQPEAGDTNDLANLRPCAAVATPEHGPTGGLGQATEAVRSTKRAVMMRRRKKGPEKAFSHAEDCKIQAADPSISIPWNEVRTGYWEARCVCGVEGWHAPVADRVRSDPLDAKTSCHAGQCEFVSATDAAVLRLALKATDKDGYWWVDFSACDTACQVPYYAESVG